MKTIEGRGIGFNAQTDNYEDLVKAGVIDPTKVVRTALQNAASIASLLLTTEAAVAEIPEEKKDSPMPGGGPRRHGRDVLDRPDVVLRNSEGPVGDSPNGPFVSRAAGGPPPPRQAGRARGQCNVKLISMVITSATGWPNRLAGTNRHWRAALIAS